MLLFLLLFLLLWRGGCCLRALALAVVLDLFNLEGVAPFLLLGVVPTAHAALDYHAGPFAQVSRIAFSLQAIAGDLDEVGTFAALTTVTT